MQLGDLGSHLYTELGIQVGQRLIHQEDAGITDDCTAHGNTLSLSTGKSLRLTVKQVLQIQDLGCLANLFVDLILRNLAELQTKCHVIINRHMRIQSVVLEDHGDITVLGINVVHDFAVDLKCAGRDLLKAGDHTKGRGFSASGRSDEDDEFLVGDLKVEILDCLETVGILFADVLQT